MTVAEPHLHELHHLAFRAMTRLHGIAACVDQVRRRSSATTVHEGAQTLLRSSERAALLIRRLWLAAEHRDGETRFHDTELPLPQPAEPRHSIANGCCVFVLLDGDRCSGYAKCCFTRRKAVIVIYLTMYIGSPNRTER